MPAGAIEHHTGTNHVGVNEILRGINAAIDVGFGSEINDGVELVLGHELIHLIGIGDIGLKKLVAVAVLSRHTLEIGQIAGVGQNVDITDVGRLVMFQNVANKVAANETAAARYQYAHRFAY